MFYLIMVKFSALFNVMSPLYWLIFGCVFFKGLVGACGISVLYNLLRVYNFVQNSK